MITLYGMSNPNVRKVLIGLEEMRLPYRTRHVAVFRGEQFDSAIIALNPMAKVPIQIDPDGPAGHEPIFESGAILIYLAEIMARSFCRQRARRAMACSNGCSCKSRAWVRRSATTAIFV